jgi:outer membrane usher protein
LLVDFRDGKYWINRKDAADIGLDTIKLNKPNNGSEVNLSDYGTVSVIEQKAQVVLEIDMKYRQETLIDLFGKTSNTMPPTRVLDAIFLNYDLRYQRQSLSGQEVNNYSAFFEANANVGETRLNYQWQKTGQSNGEYTPWERVSANIVRDDLETAVTYLVGDSFSNAGTYANPVSFTGVQIAKDFGLQPGFITQSKLDLSGVAARPSTLDIFIDNIKTRTTNVPAGPFSVNNLIGLSGSGLARIVVKDDLGNEQVITGVLFGGSNLLAEGVSTFSLQAGLMRPEQNTWDGKMMSGFYRVGLTNWLTTELNAERAEKTETLDAVHHQGVAATVASPLGIVDVSKRVGTGSQTYLGYQKLWRLNNLSLSFNANQVKHRDDYQTLGGGSVQPYRRNVQLSMSYRKITGSLLVSNST